MQSIAPLLMFQHGQCQPALDLYSRAFEDFEITQLDHFDGLEGVPAGYIKLARFRIGALQAMCFDSPAPHEFGFTPSWSFFIVVDSAEELERLHAVLSEGGEVMMPPDNYGFSQRFTWVADRFGVSWQLNLE